MDRKLMIGAVLAVGALMVVPGVAAAVARAARPAVKAAIKASVIGYREVQRAGMEVYETAEDALAEVQHELAEDDRPAASASGDQPGAGPNGSGSPGNGGQA